jgi:hypothetical protein
MIVKREDVSFDPEGGPVTIDIESGFATKGKYVASIRQQSEWETISEGDISDDVQDLLLVPYDGEELKEKRVLIVGKYAPADLTRGKQIRVIYEIWQDGKKLKTAEIEEEKEGVLLCSHTFTFKG